MSVVLTPTIEDNREKLVQIQSYYYNKQGPEYFHAPKVPQNLHQHNNPPQFILVDYISDPCPCYPGDTDIYSSSNYNVMH